MIVGSLGLFVLGASAGPCRPTDTTTTVITDLTTATATATTAPVTTSSAVPEGEPACSIESPQYGPTGEYEVYCDSFAGSTTPIGGIYLSNSLSECLDHCDESPGCVGVNYITTNVPYCTIWSSAGRFGELKGVILAKRVVATTLEPTAP
ncbi:hypothetical protein FVEN_g727 [Fusarium venenatum]|uniref:Apple domain-containing protein n=2 Tax=Fusarium venenatum TaxID=56646 RepID=A0A2L2TQA4_9HYPO|nr:uncharacterized protein FVRRES_10870 [Fusarium venenatum]KAG8361770.1 hypothetical protein FVEN_g727 [Fusarium venenatum]CEI70793.1 unnamed protein product [Fusarium venenatum]